jgi:hypothetical protein
MRWWQVPNEEIPRGREERIEWLYSWWESIDGWIAEHRPEDLPPGWRSRVSSRRP